MPKKIALLPGDGIGPEIMAEAVKVLEAVGKEFSREFTFQSLPIGGTAIDEFGDPLPPQTLQGLKESDAVLLAAVGGPKWDQNPGNLRPEAGLLRMRKELGVFANLRPVKAYEPLLHASTLKEEVLAEVDLLIVRELTGGIYFGDKSRKPHVSGEQATDTLVYTTEEIERIVRMAFVIARNRKKLLHSVDKANVLESSRLWRETVNQVAKDYPDVQCEHILVDNCAMQLIRNPRQFDVLVTENMFGDILSDEAAMLTGSIGMLPSASLGAQVGLYEPIHGSAPDIAGKGIANPLGIILSAAMMLRHSFGWEQEAAIIEQSVQEVLAKGARTADLAGPQDTKVSTSEMGDLIVQAIGCRIPS
ncbi:3-isopropylmalate dehydrogenase [Effusibacillus lacus]|uniref:3-isopropylmalate dehydrogenase n=1 Tax=Effusibacillus lacus TaxID=1348429 RepID=A0A292YNH4_9BACL|nr:3-isopropylmalate dehydrogenase [Effusibacillus lacus]TCS68942.1 3-isopropylmalate dehydrogenase [Effusibacillus lacus]GAX91488.1 3-isopropylmalate dehydrogenase [Effusibacillus lacus]